jgi:neutral ceramidase
MANVRLAAIFAAVTLAALVCLQLVAVFKHDEKSPSSSFSRNLNQWRSRANEATDDGLFLVGAGKADVTGCDHFICYTHTLDIANINQTRGRS